MTPIDTIRPPAAPVTQAPVVRPVDEAPRADAQPRDGDTSRREEMRQNGPTPFQPTPVRTYTRRGFVDGNNLGGQVDLAA